MAAVVLLVQIAATRLLSATVTYHAAFAVLALVMLALAGSSAAVYRDRARLPHGENDSYRPAKMAAYAGPILAATGVGYVGVTSIPWPAEIYNVALAGAAGTGLYLSFHACGYVIAWLLAAWPRDVGRVLFADLLGASLGCFVAVPVLAVASPVQILSACGVLATASGLLLGRRDRAFVRRYAWIAGALTCVAAVVWIEPSWVRLRSAKMLDQSSVLFERWNQLARVTVGPEVPGTADAIRVFERTQSPAEAEAQVRAWASGWAVSERWRGTAPKVLWIQLDSDAGTQIVAEGGTRPLSELDVLRWDVTAAGYWLHPDAPSRVFVIGGGGGRDFLTALAFGAPSVDVVELNPSVISAVQDTFGDFSGRPYTRPGVHYRLGDARSELARSGTRYDLIQMSMIDTWAASVSGALTLSENALYTREAFRTYLDHLSEQGVFTVSRWYTSDRYAEAARVLSLMADALTSAGVVDLPNHVAMVFNQRRSGAGVATCMMKRSAFTPSERDALVALGQRSGFGVLWPQVAGVTVQQQMDVAGVLSGRPELISGGKYRLVAAHR